MYRKLFASFLMAILLFGYGCKKEGPQGPPGNANVQSSTITFSDWIWDGTNKWSYANFTWPAITSSIVNSGAVFIYLNTSLGWVQLPRTIYPTSTYSQEQRFYYNVGTFKIIVQDSDLEPPNPALSTWTIKVVAVESSGLSVNKDLDWTNYHEVKERFDLSE